MPFSLEAVFGVDASGVRAEIKSLRKDLNNFVNDYAKLGAGLAVGAFVALSKGAIDLGSKLSDQSLQLGINVEKLQVLSAMCRDAGVSQDTLAKAVVKTRTAASQAEEGLATYTRAFSILGIKTKDFLALPAEQRLVAIGTAYKNTADKNAAYNAVAQILGEKAGPKMMEVLGTLATQSFPALEASAKKAGDVMSAETIAALDKAGDEIEAFKARITMAIGNIIVNFRTTEGLELLGMQLLKAVGVFAFRIGDAIVESGGMIWAVFKGAFLGVVNYFQDNLVTVVERIATLINKVLPSKFEINVGNLEQFRSSGKTIAEEITFAISQTKPAGVAEVVGSMWDTAIKKQQVIVDHLNAVDFAKPAKQLREAGKEMTDSGIVAAAQLTDAGKSIKKDVTESARTLSEAMQDLGQQMKVVLVSWSDMAKSINGGMLGNSAGGALNNMSDEALKELIARSRNLDTKLYKNTIGGTSAGTYGDFENARLASQAALAQQEISLRQGVRSAYASGGATAVYNRYTDRDPAILDNLIDQFAKNLPQAERTTTAVEQIARGLQRAGFATN